MNLRVRRPVNHVPNTFLPMTSMDSLCGGQDPESAGGKTEGDGGVGRGGRGRGRRGGRWTVRGERREGWREKRREETTRGGEDT